MNKEIVAAMFLDTNKTFAYYNEMYPARMDELGAHITRFAPSPTGFMHIGGLYTALLNRIFTRRNGGTFFLRIEDTDQKRLVDGGVAEIISSLHNFDVQFDEGPINETEDRGNYGPYRQSQRKDIYQAFARFLVENNKAYPCFCSEEDMTSIRNQQKDESQNLFGYYGEWAKCRNLTDDEVLNRISRGDKFIVRFKSEGKKDSFKGFSDEIKGVLNMPENVFDVVLLKHDGLPTYHFAHVVDDYLMRTTDVIRADEWIPSLPVHVQLFEAFGFEVPKYYHLSAIMKMEGESKRKLSKRKDPEARIGFYNEIGYPIKAVIDYLLTICSADYENWRKDNPDADVINFPLEITKTGISGALFDYAKLDSISRNCIAAMDENAIYDAVAVWAPEFELKLDKFIRENKEVFIKSIAVWHARRLDVRKWSDLLAFYPYMYDSDFDNCLCEIPERIRVAVEDVINVLCDYIESFDFKDEADVWFSKMKEIAVKYNYAVKISDFKKFPEKYKGSITDVSSYIRFAITSEFDTPDLYQIIGVIGAEESVSRVKKFINKLKDFCS